MKSFLFGLAVFFAGALLHGTMPVSAAGDGQDGAFAWPAVTGGLMTVQNYTEEDDGYDDGRSRRGQPKGYHDDGDRYPERRWNPRGHREYCFSCARRCNYGLCPPRCWGWWRYCRRDW
jgi:hypothetical protein